MTLRVLGLAVALWVACLSSLTAHEVRPAIADLTTEGDRLTLVLQLSAEALVAGVDLDGLDDTNASDASAAYDAARALTPEALEEALRAMSPSISERLGVNADGSSLALTLEEVAVGPIGNVDLPRDTTLTLTAPLTRGTDAVTVDWPAGYGAVILRQQGVEDPVTAFLTGGETSPPLPTKGQGGGFFCWINADWC